MALPPASHRLIIIRSPSLALPRLLASSPPPPASPAAARRLSLHPHPPAPSSPSPGLAATAGAPDRRRPKSCYRQRRPFSSHCQGDRTTTVSAQPLPGIPAVRVHVSDLVAPAWTWSACTRARSSNKFRSPLPHPPRLSPSNPAIHLHHLQSRRRYSTTMPVGTVLVTGYGLSISLPCPALLPLAAALRSAPKQLSCAQLPRAAQRSPTTLSRGEDAPACVMHSLSEEIRSCCLCA